MIQYVHKKKKSSYPIFDRASPAHQTANAKLVAQYKHPMGNNNNVMFPVSSSVPMIDRCLAYIYQRLIILNAPLRTILLSKMKAKHVNSR